MLLRSAPPAPTDGVLQLREGAQRVVTARCIQLGSPGCGRAIRIVTVSVPHGHTMHCSYGEGRKFDGRSVHAPELWTLCWNVGGDFGVVCSSFTGMHGAVCRSLWTLRDVSCLRGGR